MRFTDEYRTLFKRCMIIIINEIMESNNPDLLKLTLEIGNKVKNQDADLFRKFIRPIFDYHKEVNKDNNGVLVVSEKFITNLLKEDLYRYFDESNDAIYLVTSLYRSFKVK